MTDSVRVAFVVRLDGGNMHRRARALCAHLPPPFVGEVVPPTFREKTSADVFYVIDANRDCFAAGAAARARGRRVVFELGDPQADLFRTQGRGAHEVTAGAIVDRLVARFATAVAVRGRRLAEFLRVRVPWVELPDGVDTDVFRPADARELRTSLGVQDALVVGLVGSLKKPRPPRTSYGSEVVDAIAQLHDPSVIGLIVGAGSGLEALRRRADEAGVSERIVFAGAVPHEEIQRYVNAMDVCVSTQTDDRVGQSRTTAKLPEYLACDRFVLASDVGAAHDVLPEEMRVRYDGASDPSYPSRLAQRIAPLARRRDELRAGVGTRAIAEERYAYPVLAERLANFLGESVC